MKKTPPQEILLFFFFFQWRKKLMLVKTSVLFLPHATGKCNHSQTAKIINTSEKGQRSQDARGMGQVAQQLSLLIALSQLSEDEMHSTTGKKWQNIVISCFLANSWKTGVFAKNLYKLQWHPTRKHFKDAEGLQLDLQ